MPLDELLAVCFGIISFIIAACLSLFVLNVKWWVALLASFALALGLTFAFFIVWTLFTSRNR